MEKFLLFLGSFWRPWCQLKNVHKTAQIQIARSKIFQLNSRGNTIKVKYKFSAWQIWFKKIV